MEITTTAPEIAPELTEAIASYRRFTRFYTRVLGLLGDRLLKGGRSLTEARVLYELGGAGRTSATEIATELNLDPGYLSRILGKLEKEKLLSRKTSPSDARHSLLRLTKKGELT